MSASARGTPGSSRGPSKDPGPTPAEPRSAEASSTGNASAGPDPAGSTSAGPSGPGSTQAIKSILEETRTFPPPTDFAAQAHVKSMAEYEAMYKRSIEDPE